MAGRSGRAGKPRGEAAGIATVVALLLCLAVLVLPATAVAQERILSYDSEVDIRADGTLEVTEHIRVRAEGQDIRRGIYRDFPTRYRDRYGNRVRVDFEVISVERDGAPEPWFTERISNGVRVNTGDDSFLPVPGEFTFTFRFRTTRQLGFFETHDELYWNAIGAGWNFAVESGSVEVILPENVPVDEMGAEGYTGPQGAAGQAYTATLPGPGVARYQLTEALAPREAFTIVLTFPKGVVSAPTGGDRAGWFLADNRGVLVALIGFFGLLYFCVSRWRTVGRDPRPGVIIPRYQPPAGHGPAGLRYLTRMGYDSRCFSGDLLALAVGGRLKIHSSKKLIGEEWSLERLDPSRPAAGGSASTGSAAREPGLDEAGGTVDAASRSVAEDEGGVLPAQRTLLQKLFPAGARRLELKNTNAAVVSGAQNAHKKVLDTDFHPRYFRRNADSTGIAAAIAVATAALAFITAGGNGLPAIFLLSFLMLVVVLSFAQLVRAPTSDGRKLLDEIEGLKLYMSVAERDELARMAGPGEPPTLDADRYEALLPFAVALEVEDAWTGKFTAAVGAAAVAAATSRMSWYAGHRTFTNPGQFSQAMGKSLSSQISSASSPPGSSSGSGGGGSSGGGGGGGGGGGR